MTQAPVTPELEREAIVDETAPEEIAFEGIPGVTRSQYLVRPEDESAWLPAWQLKVDRDGTEYGVPTRLPKGQLDHYLAKRRPVDGGKRFTLHQPANLLPEPRFRCFIGDCRKRVQERIHLIRHIEVCHAQEAAGYAPMLDKLRQAIAKDNPRLAALVDDIAATPDEQIRAVSASETPAAAPVATTGQSCACGWQPKSDCKNLSAALRMHKRHCKE